MSHQSSAQVIVVQSVNFLPSYKIIPWQCNPTMAWIPIFYSVVVISFTCSHMRVYVLSCLSPPSPICCSSCRIPSNSGWFSSSVSLSASYELFEFLRPNASPALTGIGCQDVLRYCCSFRCCHGHGGNGARRRSRILCTVLPPAANSIHMITRARSVEIVTLSVKHDAFNIMITDNSVLAGLSTHISWDVQ